MLGVINKQPSSVEVVSICDYDYDEPGQFITLGVTICVQHDASEAARRAGDN